MRRPSPARQSDTACSLPSRSGATSRGTYPAWSVRSSFQTATAFGSCSFVGSGTSASAPPGVERRVGDRLGAKRHPRDRHDANARILPRHALTRRRVTQVVPGAAAVALEPQPEPIGQRRRLDGAARERGCRLGRRRSGITGRCARRRRRVRRRERRSPRSSSTDTEHRTPSRAAPGLAGRRWPSRR